jgi:acyl carrier protein
LSETILDQLNDVFRTVFADDDLVVTRGTTAADVPGWDSLMHVTLIINVEARFKIRCSSSDVAALQNVGELADLVEKRLSKQ